MRNFPKVPALYLLFFMGLIVWVTVTCFNRKKTGQTKMDMAQVQQIRNASQGSGS